jgi:hypothetical protein
MKKIIENNNAAPEMKIDILFVDILWRACQIKSKFVTSFCWFLQFSIKMG